MKHVKTLNKPNLKESAAKGGCGKCQASCQSACKTSCTVGNQPCESADMNVRKSEVRIRRAESLTAK
jgi:predicted ribosomally synthesized six-cysteine peptide SCIFF